MAGLSRSSWHHARFGLFFAALLGHLWVGLCDVLLFYAMPVGIRGALFALVALGLLGLGAWVVVILWKNIS